MSRAKQSMDGNTAAAHVAYAYTDGRIRAYRSYSVFKYFGDHSDVALRLLSDRFGCARPTRRKLWILGLR